MYTQTDEIIVPIDSAETLIEPIDSNEPRDIRVLLDLDTYQGMTDEEIESIIKYREKLAISNAETTANIAATIEWTNAEIENSAASARRALDMVESLVNRHQSRTHELKQRATVQPSETELFNG